MCNRLFNAHKSVLTYFLPAYGNYESLFNFRNCLSYLLLCIGPITDVFSSFLFIENTFSFN